MKKLFLIISFILAAVGMSLGQTTTTLTPDKGSATYSAQAITNNNIVSLLGSQTSTQTNIYNELSNINKDGDTTNQNLRTIRKQIDSLINNKVVDYEFEWLPNNVTYSVVLAPIIGTLSASSFSINLGSGYYELVKAEFMDIGGSQNATGFYVYISDSIIPLTDNVVIDLSPNYVKRNYFDRIDFTGSSFNSSGRVWFPTGGTSNGTSIPYRFTQFTGVIYYVPAVAATGANSTYRKRIRLQFKKL